VDKLHVASTAKDKCHWESVPKLRRNLCGDSNPQLPQPMACRVITYFLCGLSQAFKNAPRGADEGARNPGGLALPSRSTAASDVTSCRSSSFSTGTETH
jgi:hypothetical protein